MNKFWHKKRILVTGGSGFLGTNVCERLTKGGALVSAPRHDNYDLTKNNDVIRMYKDYPCDLVIHLAAVVGGIGANKKHPGKFFFDNLIMGTLLMEQARLFKVPKFVALGTVCSYPKNTPIPFKEKDLWNGYPEDTNAPYGLAKKMMLVQSKAYREEYGFNSIFLLPVNLYGPGDNFDPDSSHVIPALIKKCVDATETSKPTVTVWGDGSASREFLFVRDAAEAIILSAEKYNSSEPVNIGSSEEILIRDLVSIIAKETGYKGKILWDTSKPNGQPRRKLDTTKAKKEFGFVSTTTFESGLRETINWYKKNREIIKW